MTLSLQNRSITQLDFGKMTNLQKLAALLIIIGPENAATVMKAIEPKEVEMVSLEMIRMPVIEEDVQMKVLKEFSELTLHGRKAVRGGLDYTHDALEKAVGSGQASAIIGQVAPEKFSEPSMHQIGDMDPREIFNAIKNEQPQIIALVISFLPMDKSTAVLDQVPNDLRDQVIERLANLTATPLEVVEVLAQVLIKKLGRKQTRALTQSGGLKAAANLLNAIHRDKSKSILVNLEKRNPQVGQAIRQNMFTFDDLMLLDQTALQKIMREVDMRMLAVSLKSANEELKSKIFGALSKRAAETLKEEISFLGTIKLKEIEGAQKGILEVFGKLEEAGEIERPGAYAEEES